MLIEFLCLSYGGSTQLLFVCLFVFCFFFLYMIYQLTQSIFRIEEVPGFTLQNTKRLSLMSPEV